MTILYLALPQLLLYYMPKLVMGAVINTMMALKVDEMDVI